MSNGSSQAIDKQPQSLAEKNDYGSTHLQTTDGHGNGQNVRPAGFETVENLNKLEVVQRLDALEVCLGWTRNNRYCIYNDEGEQLFYVYEASVCFNRQVTGALRALALKMSLSIGDEEDVMFLGRPGACSSRCCWACCSLQTMDIGLASGTMLAKVSEVWTCCIPEYHITDDTGQFKYTLKGGVCHCRCCCQLDFQFISPNGEEAARITRSCLGCKELIGAVNRYTVTFGDNLSPQEKFIVLGSSFLVDLNYFEKQNKCW